MVQSGHIVGSLCAPWELVPLCCWFCYEKHGLLFQLFIPAHCFWFLGFLSMHQWSGVARQWGNLHALSLRLTQTWSPLETWQGHRTQALLLPLSAQATQVNSHRCHGLSFHENYSCSELHTIPRSPPQLPPNWGNYRSVTAPNHCLLHLHVIFSLWCRYSKSWC